MTPVKQTKLYSQDGIHNGNCFAACLASLLDLPLWMVPPFEDMFGRVNYWGDRRDEWLLRMFNLKIVKTEGHELHLMPEFYIASGMSARGVAHSVIYQNGFLVHDPHYSDGGIASVEWTWHLIQSSGAVTDEMVNRFLTWPVPADVYPDGIAGQPGRSGTNLLTAVQARQMLEHVHAKSKA